MKLTLFAAPGNETMGQRLTALLGAGRGQAEMRRFPDGESYVRIDTDVRGRDVAIVCTLDRPDEKFLPLIFFAATAKSLGATSLGLICPYLSYMRQDTRFHPGEGITSVYFSHALSRYFDWLVTVDPHLHRRRHLSEIYSIPCAVAHAAPLIADWIREHVPHALVVGPDSESAQWVAAVADRAEAPYVILEKNRLGDRKVTVSLPNVRRWRARTPVLVDDIISTARTMIEAIGQFRKAGFPAVFSVGIHGLFAGDAYKELLGAGATDIVTCNTVPHPSNRIDIAGALAEAVRGLFPTIGSARANDRRSSPTSEKRNRGPKKCTITA